MEKRIILPILFLSCIGGTLLVVHQSSKRQQSAHVNADIVEHGKAHNLIPVAIVGSGPAGLSSALYASRFNLHTVVFEGKRPGGQLMSTSDVENWPGIPRELGPKIIERLKNQAVQFGALMSSAMVESIDVAQWPYHLKLDDGTDVYAATIILAMGASPVTLQVPGEQKYWGKGVTSCAVCDAPFFKGKKVVVIGGGDAAVEEALQLAAHASEIVMLVRAPKMRASHAMQQRLKAYDKISVRYEAQVQEIKGDEHKVTEVTLRTKDGTEALKTDGVFLAIGHTPNTSLVKNIVACDSHGYVQIAPQRQHTSVPGIFAAGDVADHFYRQAGIASGDGIKAAIDAASFLRHHGMDDAFWNARAETEFFVPQAATVVSELRLMQSVKEFEEVISAKKIPVIVDFYTVTCPSCKMLMPHLAAAAQSYAEKALVVKVDGDKLPELMDRYAVTSLPTILVFKGGMVVARSTTLSSRREIQSFIAQFIN